MDCWQEHRHLQGIVGMSANAAVGPPSVCLEPTVVVEVVSILMAAALPGEVEATVRGFAETDVLGSRQ